MTAIGAKASFGVKTVVEFLKSIVGDLDTATTTSANQMMMNMLCGFVNQLPVTHVGGHDQTLFSEECKRAVHCWFCKARELSTRTMEDFCGRQVSACIKQNIEDCISLWSQAKAAGTELVGIGVFHEYKTICYCKFLQ